MAKARAKATKTASSALEKKLGTLRMKLVGNLSVKELQRLQLQTDLLENALVAATNDHHHDTNQHHDHDYLVDPTAVLDQVARGSRQA